MAGHSKWHNIQHRKNRQDAKRGKIFSKLIKEIAVATKSGGSVVENNSALRTAIDKALAANMKRDTINSAIKRGSGGAEGDNYEQVRYEGYGIAGTAVMLDCLTDNRKRTVAGVRHIFSKHNGNLGTDGSVAYLFSKQGLIGFKNGDEEAIMEVALECGADDIISEEDGTIVVITTAKDYFLIKDTFIKKQLIPSYSEISNEPSLRIELNKEESEKFLGFIDQLEDLDDVQEVYHNADISDEVLE